MPQKKFVSFPVIPEKTIVAIAEAFRTGAIQKASGVDYMAILRAIKTILVALGQWDALIAFVRKLKDVIPGSVDDVLIESLVSWLQSL